MIVVQGYSRDVRLADFIFLEGMKEIIRRDWCMTITLHTAAEPAVRAAVKN